MEISLKSNVNEVKEKLMTMGWLLMDSTNEPKFMQIYNKGYTKMGFAEKVYHLHVRYRDAYTDEKSNFILSVTEKARKEYGTRYL